MQPFKQAGRNPAQVQEMRERLEKQFPKKEVDAIMERTLNAPIFMNDVYQVSLFAERNEVWGVDIVHLSIRRLDNEPVFDWRDMQEIKNELLGPEIEGVQLFPAESRLVDTSNQYHLWCFADPQYRFPFGFDERLVSDESAIVKALEGVGNHRQRKRK